MKKRILLTGVATMIAFASSAQDRITADEKPAEEVVTQDSATVEEPVEDVASDIEYIKLAIALLERQTYTADNDEEVAKIKAEISEYEAKLKAILAEEEVVKDEVIAETPEERPTDEVKEETEEPVTDKEELSDIEYIKLAIEKLERIAYTNDNEEEVAKIKEQISEYEAKLKAILAEEEVVKDVVIAETSEERPTDEVKEETDEPVTDKEEISDIEYIKLAIAKLERLALATDNEEEIAEIKAEISEYEAKLKAILAEEEVSDDKFIYNLHTEIEKIEFEIVELEKLIELSDNIEEIEDLEAKIVAFDEKLSYLLEEERVIEMKDLLADIENTEITMGEIVELIEASTDREEVAELTTKLEELGEELAFLYEDEDILFNDEDKELSDIEYLKREIAKLERLIASAEDEEKIATMEEKLTVLKRKLRVLLAEEKEEPTVTEREAFKKRYAERIENFDREQAREIVFEQLIEKIEIVDERTIKVHFNQKVLVDVAIARQLRVTLSVEAESSLKAFTSTEVAVESLEVDSETAITITLSEEVDTDAKLVVGYEGTVLKSDSEALLINTATTSVTEATASITVYPNPATDCISISEDVESVTVSDLSGTVVISSTENTIEIANLNAGTYVVTAILIDGSTATEAIVVK